MSCSIQLSLELNLIGFKQKLCNVLGFFSLCCLQDSGTSASTLTSMFRGLGFAMPVRHPVGKSNFLYGSLFLMFHYFEFLNQLTVYFLVCFLYVLYSGRGVLGRGMGDMEVKPKVELPDQSRPTSSGDCKAEGTLLGRGR